MDKDARIFVAGHRGLVGRAVVQRLHAEGYKDILTVPREEMDLTDQGAVRTFFRAQCPAYVFLCAAHVGGIIANRDYPADFIGKNLMIQTNVIDAAYRHGATKLLFLGSGCIYPKGSPQPIKEEYLLSGPLEETNQWYAVAKIAAIKMCNAYRKQYGFNTFSILPSNLYGPHDNFDYETSHVVPALLRKVHDAKRAGASHVTVWGTGRARREILHVDDLADAAVCLMQRYEEGNFVNVGSGEDLEIGELAGLIQEVVGFRGALQFDTSRPDGPARKLLDSARLRAFGWWPKIGLRDGLAATYAWFLDHQQTLREIKGSSRAV